MSQVMFYYKNRNAPKPNKPNHIVVNILIEFNDMLLLEKRTDNETWGLIGGGLKIDESLKSGAI